MTSTGCWQHSLSIYGACPKAEGTRPRRLFAQACVATILPFAAALILKQSRAAKEPDPPRRIRLSSHHAIIETYTTRKSAFVKASPVERVANWMAALAPVPSLSNSKAPVTLL